MTAHQPHAAPQARLAAKGSSDGGGWTGSKRKRAEPLLAALDQEGRDFQAAKYAPNTRRSISTAMTAFLTYCRVTGDWPDLQTGISDQQMIRLIAFWARTLEYGTITSYLSMGVRQWHLENGIPYEAARERDAVDAALKGVRRIKGDTPKKRKLPITIDILIKMSQQMDPASAADASFWAAVTTAFFCLLRKGNITATSKAGAERDLQAARRADLRWSAAEGGYTLTLRATKTIQYRERELKLSLPILGDPRICPTRAMRRYLHASAAATSELLMQSPEAAGGWAPLTYAVFLEKLKATLRQAGVNPDAYAGHSLRRGGATWALSIGIPVPAIKAMGDWKSDAYLAYCEFSEQIRKRAALQMARAVPARP